VRGKDTGHVGEALGELMVQVRSLNIDKLSSQKNGLVGLFGRLSRSARAFLAQYQKVNAQIDAIVARLEDAREQLLRDVALLDGCSTERRLSSGFREIHRRRRPAPGRLRKRAAGRIEAARQKRRRRAAQKANDFRADDRPL
jgi:uncharacterized protein YdbL (DUF1318 family)